MSIENQVIDLLEKELQEVKLNINSDNTNTLGWDSQFQLVIILVIEDEFNIMIPNDRLNELNSIDKIVKLIEGLRD
ncbi:acyl carrier protein [Vibrio bathopelagicus]